MTDEGKESKPGPRPPFCQTDSCRGVMGKWRCPRPINRHAAPKAAGCWGPRHSALTPWLCLEAKPERALGPVWLDQRPCTAHLH